jgi:hypothetical protein
MHGRARLFVSSREWRVDDGRLEGEILRAHFAAGGIVEAAANRPEDAEDMPLVPPALSTAALSLEHARLGPFMDVASALAARAIVIPSFVPLDAQLNGELSWSLSHGGRAELGILSESINATLRGAVTSTGRDLDGRIDAQVHPARLLRESGLPPEAMPRDEDVVHVRLDIGGELRRPAVNGVVEAGSSASDSVDHASSRRWCCTIFGARSS